MLSAHPEVFVTRQKEPNFLSYDEIYQKGWGWYDSLFEPGRSAAARGEGSVSYAMQEYEDRVIDRLVEHLPEVRLIYIVRDPLSRIESVYREHHNSGHRNGLYMPFDLSDALEYRPATVTNTLYWERISAYRRHFPGERILVLFLEDLRRDFAEVLSRCFRFLGVDPEVGVDEAGSYLNPGTRKCYDTQLLRRIRTHPVLGPAWHTIPDVARRPLEKPLRRRFVGGVPWSAETRRKVLARVRPDAEEFLRFYGKPLTFWDLSMDE
jgi:hypothetical protein